MSLRWPLLAFALTVVVLSNVAPGFAARSISVSVAPGEMMFVVIPPGPRGCPGRRAPVWLDFDI